MKQKILIACCLLFTEMANAQLLNTNLIVNPRPSASLSDWDVKKGTITLIVLNQQGPKRAKIKVIVKASDGTEVSTTDLNRVPTQTFLDGQTVLEAPAVYPLDVQKFSGKYQTTLNKTGKLPADSYQLCVELVEEATFVSITTPKCGSFFVAGLQLPICMMPANNQELDIAKASTAITFRWTPVTPRLTTAVIYKIQVFEVLENQQPMQALRSNMPILDREIIGQTQFIWQPQGILGLPKEEVAVDSATIKKGWNGVVQEGKKFIWTIQTLDVNGNAIAVDANYEGRSEPMQFTVTNKPKGKSKKNYVGHVTLMK
jgi:hypothetical protein